MTDETPPPSEEGKDLLKTLRTPLVIELGRIKLPVQQIASLKPGSIVELHRAPGELVDLVVGDQLIGKGELVEIEGEIGIRIVSI